MLWLKKCWKFWCVFGCEGISFALISPPASPIQGQFINEDRVFLLLEVTTLHSNHSLSDWKLRTWQYFETDCVLVWSVDISSRFLSG